MVHLLYTEWLRVVVWVWGSNVNYWSSWRCSERYGVRNAEYESPLMTCRTVEYCLTVVCRAPKCVCTSCVVWRLCFLPCPNCWLYLSYRDACLLCCAMLPSYFILLIVDDDEWVGNRRTDHPLVHIILSWISETTRVIISVMMLVCDRRISSCCARNGLSCKETGLRICLKGRLLAFLEHRRA